MKLALGLRALGLLAFVAAATAVILKPELIGGVPASRTHTLHSVVALSHV